MNYQRVLTQISELAGMCHAGAIMTDESKEEELFFDLESKIDELHGEVTQMMNGTYSDKSYLEVINEQV